MNILIINGPNLNLLGEREPEVYGSESLADINTWLQQELSNDLVTLRFFQSNHEGEIIDFMQNNRRWANGMVINAGAFTHYSIAIRDAISACQLKTVEVHLSNIHAREEFRKHSVIEDVCDVQICGKGKLGYLEGIHYLLANS